MAFRYKLVHHAEAAADYRDGLFGLHVFPMNRPLHQARPGMAARLALVFLLTAAGRSLTALAETEVNDVHSRLNATTVAEIVRPASIEAVVAAVKRARQEGRRISIAGARHSMGGQQFAAGALHLESGHPRSDILA